MHSTERIIQQLARLTRRHPSPVADDRVPHGFTTVLLASLREELNLDVLWQRWSLRSAMAGLAMAGLLWFALPMPPKSEGWMAMLAEEMTLDGGFEP